jgi:hypothetical protein
MVEKKPLQPLVQCPAHRCLCRLRNFHRASDPALGVPLGSLGGRDYQPEGIHDRPLSRRGSLARIGQSGCRCLAGGADLGVQEGQGYSDKALARVGLDRILPGNRDTAERFRRGKPIPARSIRGGLERIATDLGSGHRGNSRLIPLGSASGTGPAQPASGCESSVYDLYRGNPRGSVDQRAVYEPADAASVFASPLFSALPTRRRIFAVDWRLYRGGSTKQPKPSV